MKKVFVVVTVIITIGFYACKHLPPAAVIPPPPSSGGGGSGGGAGSNLICFQTDILPLFQTNCAKAGCHDAPSNQKGYILDSYDNLFKKDGRTNNNNIKLYNPTDSKLYEVLFETGNSKMPPLPNPDLTPVQKNLIARWINEGAQNTTNCSTTCDSTQFKYGANIYPIFQNHCTGCHSGPTPQNGIDLSLYETAHDVAVSGLLYGVVAHLPGFVQMPKGSGKLSDCEIAQIRKWIEAGAPHN